jgi:hypothetical protein
MTVLKTILYFSIFKYPLTDEEIFTYTNISSKEEVKKQLSVLLDKKIVFKTDNYYTNGSTPELVSRRIKGNKMANEIMPKAIKISRKIAKFPFVESVNLSGSLSKGYYDLEDDIDFFIITKPNRLWIARTLLILYKKVFLLNSKKHFCVNYFISSNNLEISERNRFTATEMTTLIPVYGSTFYRKLLDANKWVADYFPNQKNTYNTSLRTVKKPILTLIIESILNTKAGCFIDDYFRKITLQKWNIKFNHLEKNDFNIAMKSTKNISKHHPQNFQKKVITQLEIDYKNITEKYQLELTKEHA